jgi:putrescine aminotransferase
MFQAAAPSRLITLAEALTLNRGDVIRLHERHLNPRMMKVYEFIGLDHIPVRAEGVYFWDDSGTRYTDLLSAFGTLAFGHNPPRVLNALALLHSSGTPNLVDGPSPLAAALASNLALLAPGALRRAYFANSGTEAVDAAVKLARSATGRRQLVACRGAYHGRSVAALSLMHRREYREAFEPLLADVHFVDFGDADTLDRTLRSRQVAGFVVETIQGEAGMVMPPPGYLEQVREICTRTGTLLIFDEIQCGLGRSGKLFACEHFGVVPDCLLLGKALGAGVMPLSALLTTDDLWRTGRGDRPQSPFHVSTYAANSASCAVGLTVLEMLLEERVIPQAAETGGYLLARLRDMQQRQPLLAEVRGTGLMTGFRLGRPGVLRRLSGGNSDARYLLSSLLLNRLIVKHRIVTALTLNNADVIRVQPPLDVSTDVVDHFIDALEESLKYLSGYLGAVLSSVPRIARFMRSHPVAVAYE